MQVIAYGPQFWFLLKDEADYYLSVRCQQSFAEFELLIQLNAEEGKEYHALGHEYINSLAERINDRAREYKGRDQSKQLRSKVSQAVQEWKAIHGEDAV